VRITSRKWDGGAHRDNEADLLGDDEYGRWLWMPDGTPVGGPDGVWFARAGLRLFPAGAPWWSAFFVPPHPDRAQQLYVDITTPAVVMPDLITFIDLDLDVEILGDAPPVVLDEDEFEQHRREWDYPEAVVERATRTAAEMLAAMSELAEPFGTVWRGWWSVASERFPEGSAGR
jgi:hypothetical protein